jgi:ribose/xylose/arabinose/galactoside ABC-type transport system permease subunit
MINNGLNLLNVPIYWQEMTVGLLLLGALAIEMQRGTKLKTLFLGSS